MKPFFTSLLLLLATCFAGIHTAQAQATGIGTSSSAPDANAMLDVNATNKGVLIPRIDYANRPLGQVASGMLIYVTANGPQGNNAFYYYNGSSWSKVRNDSEQQQLSLSNDTLFLSQGNYVVLGAVFTSQGYIKCGTQYTNPQTDNQNCGACGVVCPAGQVCSGGTCVLSCQSGLTNCSGVCRNLQSDVQNCGACGRTCAAGYVCSGGNCVVSCQAGLTNCSGNCRNVQTDNQNCGACGVVCPAGQVCNGGSCVLSCQAGLTNCGGTCRNLQSDNNNCGNCGSFCAAGYVCAGGNCVLSCQAGLTNCSGTCRSLSSDNLNCGICGRACAAGTKCVNGSCVTQ